MKKGAKTNRSGKPLEYISEQLAHCGFQEINGAQFSKIDVFPNRYVRTNVPYITIYGTKGFHEILIVTSEQNGFHFLADDIDKLIKIIVECKFQSTSGSTDEKIPYILETFKNSNVRNWILVLDGAWWIKTDRGKAVVNYVKKTSFLIF
jgi:PD-(D/E)XK nuclease superfamily protein